MTGMLKNNKGIVLITTYFVLVVLLGFTAVTFVRSINESRLSQRNSDSLEAFYQAEAGIAYAYAEASASGFIWYTHVDRNRTTTTENLNSFRTDIDNTQFDLTGLTDNYTATINLANASIDSANGLYTVSGKNFRVKAYPEIRDGEFTGIVVIHSQATVNGITRSVEYRLGQSSAYGYFFFYPESHIFDTATYDARNFGGIHVSGDIIFKGNPQFHYLTALTSAGKPGTNTGYIYRQQVSQFFNGYGATNYDTSVTYPFDLTYEMYTNTNYRFSMGTTYFKVGDTDFPTTIELASYLDGEGAGYDFDKYQGDPGDSQDNLPLSYDLDRANYKALKDLATYEMCGNTGAVTLLDDSKTISINIDGTSYNLGEEALFETAYNAEQEGKSVNWDTFWTQWKINHLNDASYADGKNWQRRFYWAAYDGWSDIETPDGVNMEWWEDMEYGSDRALLGTTDMSPAKVVDTYGGGEDLEQWFLNTEKQDRAWAAWLAENSLNKSGSEITMVRDISQGARYIDPGKIAGGDQTDYVAFQEKAVAAGIVIGLVGTNECDFNEDGKVDTDDETIMQDGQTGYGLGDFDYNGVVDQGDWDYFNSQVGQIGWEIDSETFDGNYAWEASFYNARRPNMVNRAFAPSNILVVDVNKLSLWIDEKRPNFNGIVYADLTSFFGDNPQKNDDGIMLINAERLPKGGLSIVTPNNVFIKGNYNLDPNGHTDEEGSVIIGRERDDENVINRVVTTKNYIRTSSDLKWQPAEIITKRAVYTLSEDFPEPQYMPMASNQQQQYNHEQWGDVPSQLVKDNNSYPTNNWVPTPLTTYNATQLVQKWFNDPDTPDTLPDSWYDWLVNTSGNWPSKTVYHIDTNGDEIKDEYILGNDLRNAVYYNIARAYTTNFAYDPDKTVSLINPVSEKHIYNTAIITPYDTSPYVLENWSGTDRVINGAFIELPDKWLYKRGLNAEAYYRRTAAPNNFFNYETRFGRGADEATRPAAGLVFGADSSWREINSGNF